MVWICNTGLPEGEASQVQVIAYQRTIPLPLPGMALHDGEELKMMTGDPSMKVIRCLVLYYMKEAATEATEATEA
jgi:hypothetical protein